MLIFVWLALLILTEPICLLNPSLLPDGRIQSETLALPGIKPVLPLPSIKGSCTGMTALLFNPIVFTSADANQ
jgi:hypothetical protein